MGTQQRVLKACGLAGGLGGSRGADKKSVAYPDLKAHTCFIAARPSAFIGDRETNRAPAPTRTREQRYALTAQFASRKTLR
jgi:hypothetical protein